MLEFWIDPQSPYCKPVFNDDKRFVFFSAPPAGAPRSRRTAQRMGLRSVTHVGGGFGAWREAGGPGDRRRANSPATRGQMP